MNLKTNLQNPEVLRRSKADFRVQYFKSSGPGGQHRNKTETAVRITDIETGLTCEATESRSREMNKRRAFERLVVKLIKHYEAIEAVNDERKINLGWADKIRTYNEKADRVIDHRTGARQSFTKTLDGDLALFIEEMQKCSQT